MFQNFLSFFFFLLTFEKVFKKYLAIRSETRSNANVKQQPLQYIKQRARRQL